MKVVVLGAGTAGLITALLLREKYPTYSITIIKSGEIGTVGVGEGSTEHWAKFIDFVGIDVLELIHDTSATVKIGILFKNWSKGSDYVHSISDYSTSGIGRPEIFNHFLLSSDSSLFPLAPHFEYTYSKNLVEHHHAFRPSNQYHFDTHKLIDYLIKKCKERSIEIDDAIVTDIILNDAGDLSSLVTDITNITGDLFIDCSGFKKVLSSKLGNKWVPKTDFLPLNRAIAFPTELDDRNNIEPYTTSTALSAGWSWKIPTQDRYGNGYVFSTNYTDSDKALFELTGVLGKNIEKFAKDIPFEAGKVEKFWCKNVICVGLAGSFAEPLEAQSIGFTIVQAFALLGYLDVWPYNKKVCERFNTEMNEVYDNIIDYLQLHYLGNRNDTKFWQDKPFKLTDFNKDTLPLFNRGIFEQSLFKDTFMFAVPNFYQVAAGIGLIDTQILSDTMRSNRQNYNSVYLEAAKNYRESYKTRNVLSHYEYIKLAKSNYLHKRGLNES